MWPGLITAVKDLAKDIKEFKKEERRDLSSLFDVTGDLLLQIVEEFEKDNYPDVECATIETIGNNIAKNMTRMIRKKKRNEILEYFKPFQSLKDEWEKRKDPTCIDEMKFAAGEFKGLAILFKI